MGEEAVEGGRVVGGEDLVGVVEGEGEGEGRFIEGVAGAEDRAVGVARMGWDDNGGWGGVGCEVDG